MPVALFVCLLVTSGCFYLGPATPWDEEEPASDEVQLLGCDPANKTEVLVADRWQHYSFHCQVTGSAFLTWSLRYPDADGDEQMRVVATGVPYLLLDGRSIPWEYGVVDGFLTLEVHDEADAALPVANQWWSLRLLEPVP